MTREIPGQENLRSDSGSVKQDSRFGAQVTGTIFRLFFLQSEGEARIRVRGRLIHVIDEVKMTRVADLGLPAVRKLALRGGKGGGRRGRRDK